MKKICSRNYGGEKLIEIFTLAYIMVLPIAACLIAQDMRYTILTAMYFLVLAALTMMRGGAKWFVALSSLFFLITPALLFIAAVHKATEY